MLSLRIPIRKFRHLVLLLLLAPAFLWLPAQAYDVTPLTVGVPREQEIKGGGDSHTFGVSLKAGDYAALVIRRQSANLLAIVSAPNEQSATTHESPAGPESALNIPILALTAGTYTIQVKPLESWTAPGRFEIRLDDIRVARPEDQKRYQAARKVAEGRTQQLSDTKSSRETAIKTYQEALALWNELGDPVEQANTLYLIAQTHKAFGRSNSKQALDYLTQAVSLRPPEDVQAKAYSILGMADLYREQFKIQESIPHYQAALELFKAGGNRRGVAAAHYGMGLVYGRVREPEKAREHYDVALQIYSEDLTRDRNEEARTLHAIGGSYDIQGSPDQARLYYQRALTICRETGDKAAEGNIHNSIAKLDDDRGNSQGAIDNYNTALTLLKEAEGKRRREYSSVERLKAVVLYNFAYTYAALGDFAKAFDLLEQSLQLRKDAAGEAITLMMTGYVHTMAGDPEKALDYCSRALPLQEEAGDPRKSQTFTVMGIARAMKADHKAALELFDRALQLQSKDSQAAAITHSRVGESYAALGAHQEAIDAYSRANQLFLKHEDLNGSALALYGIARVESDRNNFNAALKHVEAALTAIEPLRANVTSQQLRMSYFAGKIDYYELYIDLKMQLRDGRNDAAFTTAAFEASERATARSLLDTLAESRVDAALKSDPQLAALVDQYRRLNAELKKEQAAHTKTSDADVSRLRMERDAVEKQIRTSYTRYAELMHPQPLTLAQVQSLLGEHTVLLKFSLGQKRSYLWSVTTAGVRGYTLPARTEIESTAWQLVDLLRTGQQAGEPAFQRRARMAKNETKYWPLATKFSRLLLGKVQELEHKKRVIIVADGTLRYLPFAALPQPYESKTSRQPRQLQYFLAQDHEIIGLPSASVLSVLRANKRGPISKSIAVFADPVFESDDPRIKSESSTRMAGPPTERREALSRALRDLDDSDNLSQLGRLPASAREANEIALLAPQGSAFKAIGFDANRENVTAASSGQYSIFHLATHGILNEKNPELSGVVLSLYDRQGRFHEEGYLYLKDIYTLNFPVDLIVLSACRTALGKEMKGEGLIGLTRGFMHAGAQQVLATLWKIDDDATAAFMKHFYRKMLQDGMTPSAALSAAQKLMAEDRRWSHPYYWAGFTLQGESNQESR